jgi:polysaccharide export outer membrane protein
VWIALGAAIASAGPSEPTKVTSPETLPEAEYKIGSDDVLTINVWKEPELSRDVPVRPDGKISLPLIGDMVASGRTPAELQTSIRDQLSRFVSHPEVTVIVKEVKSHRFNIVGEVERPGSYALSTPMTVLDGIAIAGGFRDFAKTGKIYVLRINGDGAHIRLPFNYKKVIKGENFQQNVKLEPRDTIVVP